MLIFCAVDFKHKKSLPLITKPGAEKKSPAYIWPREETFLKPSSSLSILGVFISRRFWTNGFSEKKPYDAKIWRSGLFLLLFTYEISKGYATSLFFSMNSTQDATFSPLNPKIIPLWCRNVLTTHLASAFFSISKLINFISLNFIAVINASFLRSIDMSSSRRSSITSKYPFYKA